MDLSAAFDMVDHDLFVTRAEKPIWNMPQCNCLARELPQVSWQLSWALPVSSLC